VSRRNGEHPIFARWYDFIAGVEERKGYGELRERALAPARGRLLAVGLGPGYDLLHLPAAVTEVIGVEPDPMMRRIAARRAAQAKVPVAIVAGQGEWLPVEDASVDTVLLALVLCSVRAAPMLLGEAQRVLRPGGEVLVLEHVRDHEGSSLARWQDRLAPAWSVLSGGCRPNRRTREAFEQAGFDVSGLTQTRIAGLPPLLAPHLYGRARPIAQRQAEPQINLTWAAGTGEVPDGLLHRR
jgi:ubiquinone/menaquinone biosynthesis C-methylase UbiE